MFLLIYNDRSGEYLEEVPVGASPDKALLEGMVATLNHSLTHIRAAIDSKVAGAVIGRELQQWNVIYGRSLNVEIGFSDFFYEDDMPLFSIKEVPDLG